MQNILLFLFSFITLISSAQTSVWKAEKDGNKIYFGSDFGSMMQSYYPLPNEYYRAFSDADILVLTRDKWEYNAAEYIERNTLPDGNELKDEVSPKVYDKFLAVCSDLEISIDEIKHFNAKLAINHLYDLTNKKTKFNAYSIETFFRIKTEKAEVKTEFLETNQEYYDYRNKIDYDKKMDQIFNSLDDLKYNAKDQKSYYKNWVNGKTKPVEESILKLKTDDAKHYQFDIVEKNKIYLEKLLQYLTSPEIEFVLLSRMNLLGEDGIFEMLKLDGYYIQQIKF